MRLAGALIAVLMMTVLGTSSLAAQAKDAWLGVTLEVVKSDAADKLGIDGGLKVTKIYDKSPAKESGLEVGDIVLSAGEDTVTTIEQMRAIMTKKAPGDMLSLGVRHSNGRTEPLMITLGNRADSKGEFADDAKVKELRERLRDLDAERRRLRKKLDERLKELRNGKADVDEIPTPAETDDEQETTEPEVKKPERTPLTVSMGASFVNLDAEEASELGITGGIRITRVKKESAAAEAGLKVDDVVVLVDGEKVAGTGDLRTILGNRSPGDRLEVELIRNDKRENKTVVLRAKNSN